MNRYEAWIHECLVFAYAHVAGIMVIAFLMEACIVAGQSYLSLFTEGSGTRIGFADSLLMLVSPPQILMPIPQTLLGPLTILVLYVQTKPDESYNRIVRMGRRGLWAKRAFVASFLAVAISTLYFVLLCITSFERYGASGGLSGQASSLFTLYTGSSLSQSPSLAAVICIAWLDILTSVLVEVVLFLILYKVLGSALASFAIIVVVAHISLVYVRIPPILHSGYYFFATENHLLYFLPLLFSAVLLAIPQLIFMGRRRLS